MAFKCFRILFTVLLWMYFSATAVVTYAQAPHMALTAAGNDTPNCGSLQVASLTIDATQMETPSLTLIACDPSEQGFTWGDDVQAALACPSDGTFFTPFGGEGSPAEMDVTCQPLLRRQGLRLSGRLDIPPIQAFLAHNHFQSLSIRILPPGYGSVNCQADNQQNSALGNQRHACAFTLDASANQPSAILYSFGFDRASIARMISVFAFLLLIPIALTFWFRRRASSALEDSKPAIVFAYRRFITSTAWGGVLSWWLAIDVFHADGFVEFLLFPIRSHDTFVLFLPWFLLWIPPAIVYFVCLALSPVHLLRGVNRTQIQALNQSFWAVARIALPLAILIPAIFEFSSSPRIAVVLLAVWLVVARITSLKAADAHGMELQALTSGEIRDRAFALAKKAGAKLNQLYVLPTERMRLANAFAHAANNVYLTDYLLKNLNRREVDAIIGHEITHLQKKHVRMRILAWVATTLVIGFVETPQQQWIPASIPVGPLFYGGFLLIVFFLSRRNEFAADAGAYKLTGDAEAMITGLARVSRLNTTPIHWGKLDEKILTHPSTLRRMKHLAQLGGMSEACVPELLNQSLAPPTDTYPVPATARPSGKIFSTRFKTNVSWLLAWSLTVCAAATPAVFASLAREARLVGRPLFLVLILGVIVSAALCLVLPNFLALRGMGSVEKKLRVRLEKERAPAEIRSGLFVSVAPDSSPRLYEGNYAWDVGFLAISENNLYYWGEEARFILSREQVTSVESGRGPVNWFETPSIYISWRDSRGVARVFNIRALSSRSMFQMAAQTRRLTTALQSWHRRISQPVGSILSTISKDLPSAEGLGVPAFGEVTSASPKLLVRGNFLSRFFLLDSLVATAVALLFGFQIPLLNPISTGSAPLDFNSSGAAYLYVLVSVWLVRVSLLWPYWRFHEVRAELDPKTAPQPSSNQL